MVQVSCAYASGNGREQPALSGSEHSLAGWSVGEGRVVAPRLILTAVRQSVAGTRSKHEGRAGAARGNTRGTG